MNCWTTSSLCLSRARLFRCFSKLVEEYESQWQEELDVEPRELVVFHGAKQPYATPPDTRVGSSSRASEYLSGKRNLSLPQILKLEKRFHLSPTAFISKEQIKEAR